MGVQVPCRVHAEVPQEAAVWANQAAPRHCISRACQAQGMQDRRRTSDARPRAYPDIDPAEVFGGGGDRVLEREKLDLDCAECGTQAAQFSWPQILDRSCCWLCSAAARTLSITEASLASGEEAQR